MRILKLLPSWYPYGLHFFHLQECIVCSLGCVFKTNRTKVLYAVSIECVFSEDMRCKINASNRNESFPKIQMKTQPIERQQVVQVATNREKGISEWLKLAWFFQMKLFKQHKSVKCRILKFAISKEFCSGPKMQGFYISDFFRFMVFPLQWSSFLKNTGSPEPWAEIHLK